MPSMDEIIGGAGAVGKEIAPDDPVSRAEITILPPHAEQPANESRALAVVRRLARDQSIAPALELALAGTLGEAVRTASEFAAGAVSDSTKAIYERDWQHFAAWCVDQGIDAGDLPIHPVVIAAYIGSQAASLGRSALNVRVAAIAYEHRRRGHTWTARHPAIRDTLAGVRRSRKEKARPAAALCSDEVKQLLTACPEDLAGLRDRALFLMALATAFRRSEVVGMDVVHLRLGARDVTVHLPSSKTDQEGEGADIVVPRMTDEAGRPSETCPVRALEAWLRHAKISRGAVFRSVTATGRLGDRLSADGMRYILLQRAGRAKLTVHESERLSPHGLRAGFITEAYLQGAADEQVQAHVRHADLRSTRGYRRRAKITTDNPARLLKL